METSDLFTRIPKELKKELNHYCAEHETTLKQVVEKALRQFLEAEKQAK